MKPNEQKQMGQGGFCICLKCGRREPHQAGVPCKQTRCPACGVVMLREGSAHHRAALAKAKNKQSKNEGSKDEA